MEHNKARVPGAPPTPGDNSTAGEEATGSSWFSSIVQRLAMGLHSTIDDDDVDEEAGADNTEYEDRGVEDEEEEEEEEEEDEDEDTAFDVETHGHVLLGVRAYRHLLRARGGRAAPLLNRQAQNVPQWALPIITNPEGTEAKCLLELAAHAQVWGTTRESVLMEELLFFLHRLSAADATGGAEALARIGRLAVQPLNWWSPADAHCPLPLTLDAGTVERLAMRCYAISVPLLRGTAAYFLAALIKDTSQRQFANQLDHVLHAMCIGAFTLRPDRPRPRMLLVARTSESYKRLLRAYAESDGNGERTRTCLDALQVSVPYVLVAALCSLAPEEPGFAAEEPLEQDTTAVVAAGTSIMPETDVSGDTGAVPSSSSERHATRRVIDTESWVALPELVWPQMAAMR